MIPGTATSHSLAVDRVASILSLYREQPVWGISALAARLGEHKSVIHRVVAGLARHGFLEQEAGSRKYRLGLLFLEYGDLVANRLELRALCASVLRELTAATGETALVSVLRNNYCICIDKVDTPERVKVVYEIGSRNPPHAGAAALAIVAFLPPAELDQVVGPGPYPVVCYNTPPTRDALDQRLQETRSLGYSVTAGDLDPGVLAIAAPVFDRHGRAVASLCVAGPQDRLWSSRQQIIDAVCRHSRSVSAKLGHLTDGIAAGGDPGGDLGMAGTVQRLVTPKPARRPHTRRAD